MNYEKAKEYIDSPYLYANVTALEAVNCPVNKKLTEVNGVTLLGTDVPYPGLEAKLLTPAA